MDNAILKADQYNNGSKDETDRCFHRRTVSQSSVSSQNRLLYLAQYHCNIFLANTTDAAHFLLKNSVQLIQINLWLDHKPDLASPLAVRVPRFCIVPVVVEGYPVVGDLLGLICARGDTQCT